jgi:hypothetical protein
VYRSLTIEFMSSFTCTGLGERDPADMERTVSFRLCLHQFEMTLERFAVVTGIYTISEVTSPLYTDAVWRLDRAVLVPFWDYLTDHRHHFGATYGQIAQVRDPLYRVLHHLLARSIVPRERSRDKVNQSDLFHLFCILTGRPCNLAACLAMYFDSIHHRKSQAMLYGGCFVTVIALKLGVDLSDSGEGVGPDPFGRGNLLPMHVLRRFGPGQWSLVSDPADQVPFVFNICRKTLSSCLFI